MFLKMQSLLNELNKVFTIVEGKKRNIEGQEKESDEFSIFEREWRYPFNGNRILYESLTDKGRFSINEVIDFFKNHDIRLLLHGDRLERIQMSPKLVYVAKNIELDTFNLKKYTEEQKLEFRRKFEALGNIEYQQLTLTDLGNWWAPENQNDGNEDFIESTEKVAIRIAKILGDSYKDELMLKVVIEYISPEPILLLRSDYNVNNSTNEKYAKYLKRFDSINSEGGSIIEFFPSDMPESFKIVEESFQ